MSRLLAFAIVAQAACSSSKPPSSKPDKPTPSIDPRAGSAGSSGSSGSSGSGAGSGANQKVLIKQPFSLEVLAIELHGTPDPAATDAGERFTAALRAAAREYDALHLGSKNMQLVDEKIVMNCATEAPKCMANIAHSLDADRIVYGHASVDGKHLKADLHLLIADTKYVIDYDVADSGTTDDALHVTARDAMASLLGRAP